MSARSQETRSTADRVASLPPPLPRGWIDDSLPIARALIGAGFVAFSSYATVALFGGDVQPILGAMRRIGLMDDRYWFGLLVALFLFIGQIMTAERAPAIYGALLIPDTYYTARQMQPGVLALLLAYGATGAGLLAGLTAWGVLMAEGKGGRWALIVGMFLGLTLWGIMNALALPEWVLPYLAWLLAGIDGYLIARFGEILLFGKRRT